MSKIATNTKFRLLKVPGDGDCFYHAFLVGLQRAGCLKDMDLQASQLRAYVAKKIELDLDLFDDLVSEWLDFGVISRSKHGVLHFTDDNERVTANRAATRIRHGDWATSTVIHILATAFRVEVFIVEYISGKQYVQSFPSAWKQDLGPKDVTPCATSSPRACIHLLKSPHHFDLLESHETKVKDKTGGYQEHTTRFSGSTIIVIVTMFLVFALQ